MFRLALPTLRTVAPATVSRRTFVASAASRDLKSAADELNHKAGETLKKGASESALLSLSLFSSRSRRRARR